MLPKTLTQWINRNVALYLTSSNLAKLTDWGGKSPSATGSAALRLQNKMAQLVENHWSMVQCTVKDMNVTFHNKYMKVKYDCRSRLVQSWIRLLWTQESDRRLFNLCGDRHLQSKSELYLYVAYSIKVALDKRIVQRQAIAWRLLRQIIATSSLFCKRPIVKATFV